MGELNADLACVASFVLYGLKEDGLECLTSKLGRTSSWTPYSKLEGQAKLGRAYWACTTGSSPPPVEPAPLAHATSRPVPVEP